MWLLTDLSLPHLRRHLWRTALTVLGIAVGVAAMVATTSVTDAVFEAFRHAVEVSAGRAQLHVSNGTAGVSEELVDEVRRVPGVAAAAPIVTGVVSLSGDRQGMLAIVGMDLLADEEHEVQLPRSAVHIADEIEFVSQPTSIAVTARFARGWRAFVGEVLEVVTPGGTQRLTVRGIIDDIGPASLFGGAVGMMDLPAAQRLLSMEGRVDQVDVRIAPTHDVAAVAREITQRIDGRGRVADTQAHGARGEDLFFSVRVMLSIAALVAIVVGFFIIYHTVSVSVLQRRREIGLLDALGVSPDAVLAWLSVEAVAFGAVAGALGYAIGIGAARVSLGTFGTVVTAFARLPDATVVVDGGRFGLAVAVGVVSTLAATAVPALAVLRQETAQVLHVAGSLAKHGIGTRWSAAVGVCGLAVAVGMITFAPRTLPYVPLVAYVFSVTSLVLISAGLFCPLVTGLVGAAAGFIAARRRGLALILASRAIARNPAGSVAVVTAIVMGMGWTLADVSLIESFRGSWLGWIDRHYQSDLILGAGPASVSFLTAPPVSDEVVEALRTLPGVAEVQGLRVADVARDGKTTVVQAFDEARSALPLQDGGREGAPFWNGDGILVNQQLAHLEGISVGDTVALPTPAGTRRFPVLGVFADYRVGYLPSVAMSRRLYLDLWHDRSVSTVRVWIRPGADLTAVRTEIERAVGTRFGMHAITAAEFRGAVAELTESIFALHYAVVLIALLVSIVGVTNFLLSSTADRADEFRMLVATGVPSQQITGAIVTEGALLGAVGSLLGLAAGYVSSRIIVLHSVPMVNGWAFDFRFPVPTAVRLCVAAVALAGLAGLLPARVVNRRPVTTGEPA